ncbi:peptidase S8 [Planctomyces bekefii]|uniref:Peptidase S8 n=1 Tax=Planctomyces bekefii TaxID=1653850 RepID=A0A5C6MHX9_9PLAN|nr:peptidase S8 [Planctomyces bekefii]
MNVKPLANLPEKFDWREEIEGGTQPIRNQGNCGSCWAFSITAVVESLMKMKDPSSTPNLSEQTLVDCSDYDCGGGYFDAFDYVQTRGLTDRGAYPYRATNGRCRVTSEMSRQKVVSWNYIGNNGNSPTTEQIKTAILTYGPVSVDVAVAGNFSRYSSGVYNTCSPGMINHMVNIEGWNDADGGYWIMRNSWGDDWGEGGYMRIRYTNSRGGKCSHIGDTAAFAVLTDE